MPVQSLRGGNLDVVAQVGLLRPRELSFMETTSQKPRSAWRIALPLVIFAVPILACFALMFWGGQSENQTANSGAGGGSPPRKDEPVAAEKPDPAAAQREMDLARKRAEDAERSAAAAEQIEELARRAEEELKQQESMAMESPPRPSAGFPRDSLPRASVPSRGPASIPPPRSAPPPASAPPPSSAPPRSSAPDAAAPPAGGGYEGRTTSADLPTPVSQGAVWLHFATDREWTGSTRQPKWFAAEQKQAGGELAYGMCMVTIPIQVHERNRVEKPLSIFSYTFPEDPRKHVVVEQPLRTPRDKFFSRLATEVQRRPETEREVLIFIHGFNNTFDDAASRLGVLVYDMDFNGVPLLYSWSSAGSGTPIGYKHDEHTVAYTVDAFTDFLRDAVKSTRAAGARRCNVVAHSMGNRALVEALKRLAPECGGQPMFEEVVMAAPDVPAYGFKEMTWSKIQGPSRRLTLYASARDKALLLSQSFSTFSRIGQSGPDLLLLENLDTIDASDVDFTDLGLNHTYFGGRTVLQDLRQLLRDGWEPPRRKLEPRDREKLRFWVFPKTAAGSRKSEWSVPRLALAAMHS